MKINRKHITVFEHQSLKVNQEIDGVIFDEHRLKAMQGYYGDKGVPYFSLIHNGIRFKEYVGVIQIGNIIIEVLPKADIAFSGTDDKRLWRGVLIDMLFAVNVFDIHAPSSSALKLKPNSILDLYFELFINEVEYLFHNGLIKQYRKEEANVKSLKGSLQFGKNLQQNLTHQERFYVRYNTYDVKHILHSILYKTIRLLKQINTNISLNSRLGALLLYFPEMPELKVTDVTFKKIIYTRKNHSYKKSIEIAKLLLLNYHPDISKGSNEVLALMFDMNRLWEQFVYKSLRKHKQKDTTITAQTSKLFWKSELGTHSKMRPDIVINKDKADCVVLDTKWKNLNNSIPSPDDLRQMFVYHEYYDAKKVALVYPGAKSFKSFGTYLDPKTGSKLDKECSVLSFSVETKINKWQQSIHNDFEKWSNISSKEELK